MVTEIWKTVSPKYRFAGTGRVAGIWKESMHAAGAISNCLNINKKMEGKR
jgi:hypothetical protein